MGNAYMGLSKVPAHIVAPIPGINGVDYIIVGGAVLCAIIKDRTNIDVPVKDVDVMVLNHTPAYYNTLRNFLVGATRVEVEDQSAVRTVERDSTLNGVWKIPGRDYLIDLIVDTRHETISDAIDSFDLVNSMVWYDHMYTQAIMSTMAYSSWAMGYITIANRKATTFDRVIKYIGKYKILMMAALNNRTMA